jgi:hypothetical protein
VGTRRRLERLEGHLRTETAPPEWEEWSELLKRLSTDELRWLSEPSEEAASLVPCPHVEKIFCGCRSDERERRGFEAYPELAEEFIRRVNALLERTSEIMGREVWRHAKR